MKATRISAQRAYEIVSNVKSFIHIGGFETGKRVNLKKAVNYCISSVHETVQIEDMQYEVEYCNEIKIHMTNCCGVFYEMWFTKDSNVKFHSISIDGIQFIFATFMGWCNVWCINEMKPSTTEVVEMEAVESTTTSAMPRQEKLNIVELEIKKGLTNLALATVNDAVIETVRMLKGMGCSTITSNMPVEEVNGTEIASYESPITRVTVSVYCTVCDDDTRIYSVCVRGGKPTDVIVKEIPVYNAYNLFAMSSEIEQMYETDLVAYSAHRGMSGYPKGHLFQSYFKMDTTVFMRLRHADGQLDDEIINPRFTVTELIAIGCDTYISVTNPDTFNIYRLEIDKRYVDAVLDESIELKEEKIINNTLYPQAVIRVCLYRQGHTMMTNEEGQTRPLPYHVTRMRDVIEHYKNLSEINDVIYIIPTVY